jgi:hypothetical protein
MATRGALASAGCSSRGGRPAWGPSSPEPMLVGSEANGDRHPSSLMVRPVSLLSSLWWYHALMHASSPFVSSWATSEVMVYGPVKTLLGGSRRLPRRRLRAPCPPWRRGHSLSRVSISRVPGETLGPVRRSGRWQRHDVALFLKTLSWLPEVWFLR